MFPTIKQGKTKGSFEAEGDISKLMVSHLEMMAALMKKADQREELMVENLMAIRSTLDDIKMDAQSNWGSVTASLSKLSKIGMAILKVERLTNTGIQQFGKATKEIHESENKKRTDSKRSASAEKERDSPTNKAGTANDMNQHNHQTLEREFMDHNDQGQKLAELFKIPAHRQENGMDMSRLGQLMNGMAHTQPLPYGHNHGPMQIPPFFNGVPPGFAPPFIPPDPNMAQMTPDMMQMARMFAQQQYQQLNLAPEPPRMANSLPGVFGMQPNMPLGAFVGMANQSGFPAPGAPPGMYQGMPAMPGLTGLPGVLGINNLANIIGPDQTQRNGLPPNNNTTGSPQPHQVAPHPLDGISRNIITLAGNQAHQERNDSIQQASEAQSPNILSSTKTHLPMTSSITENFVPQPVPNDPAPPPPKAAELTD